MRTETIRALDFYGGTVLCAVLTWHRRLFERESDQQSARLPSRKVLFLKLIEQGATVLAYDAVTRAAKLVGRENVFFCVFAENREIVHLMDLVPSENVLVIRSERISHFLRDVLRAIRRVRQLDVDTVIDMEFLSRASAILAYLMGARRRVGLHRFSEEAPYRGDLMTHRVFHNPLVHTARHYRLLVDALDADPSDLPLVKVPAAAPQDELSSFVPRPAETERIQALLDQSLGREVERPIILLNPNCADRLPLRRWPTERFIELARRVLADHETATVVITGSPSERSAAEEICRRIDSSRAVCLAGKTTLRELLVLYDFADLLVTNDSGPGHFAALTSIDGIVLFGPAAPSQFGPLGGRSRALWAGLACSPCATVYNHRFSPCTNNVCMQAISVENVYAEIVARLAARGYRNRTQSEADQTTKGEGSEAAELD